MTNLAYLTRHRQSIQQDRQQAQLDRTFFNLRDWWAEQAWTRQTCVLCSKPTYQLHHSRYGIPKRREPFYLVPLCNHHHNDFERNIWPWLRKYKLSRHEASLFYITHGERLHLLMDGVPRVGVSPVQQALWGDNS